MDWGGAGRLGGEAVNKRFLRENNSNGTSLSIVVTVYDEGVRVMKISNIQTMRVDWSDESFVDEKYYNKYPQFQIKKNDLVFALTRPIISTGIKATIVENEEKILLNQRNAVLKPYKGLSKNWIYFIIIDNQFVQAFDNLIDKTGQEPKFQHSTLKIIDLFPFPSLKNKQQYLTS